jgi:hypothetical protein
MGKTPTDTPETTSPDPTRAQGHGLSPTYQEILSRVVALEQFLDGVRTDQDAEDVARQLAYRLLRCMRGEERYRRAFMSPLVIGKQLFGAVGNARAILMTPMTPRAPEDADRPATGPAPRRGA